MRLSFLAVFILPAIARAEWPQPYSFISVEERKKQRDEVCKTLPEAALFTKRYGHVAVAALQQCNKQPELGKRFIAAPWDRLKQPEALLDAAAKHGAPVCEFIAIRHEELLQPGAVSAFLKHPLECAWDLAPIQPVEAPPVPQLPAPAKADGLLAAVTDWRVLLCVGTALGLGVGIGYKVRRRVP